MQRRPGHSTAFRGNEAGQTLLTEFQMTELSSVSNFLGVCCGGCAWSLFQRDTDDICCRPSLLRPSMRVLIYFCVLLSRFNPAFGMDINF